MQSSKVDLNEFLKELNDFLKLIPNKVYHAHDGVVEAFSKKNLTFLCACGETHGVKECTAIIDTGLSNMAVYACNEYLAFNLVKAEGLFSIKGLKTLSKLKCTNMEQAEIVMMKLNVRKIRG